MNNMGKQIDTSHLWMTSVGFVWRQLEIVTYQLKKMNIQSAFNKKDPELNLPCIYA